MCAGGRAGMCMSRIQIASMRIHHCNPVVRPPRSARLDTPDPIDGSIT